MTREDYVSFETAKLLKEKGFDVYVKSYYNRAAEFNGNMALWNYNIADFRYSAPTLQMAMKWLREVHKLYMYTAFAGMEEVWFSRIYDKYKHLKDLDNFKTYEEACEAAIKYCLKNLIKNEDEEESEIPVPKTVDEAISTLEKILSDEDREYLLKNGAISMHHSLGRWIRNEWGLWTGSELKDELMNMNKGLNHPDDMSNYIIEEFIKYWNNKL